MQASQSITVRIAGLLVGLALSAAAQATLTTDVTVRLVAPGGISGIPASAFDVSQVAPLATGISAPDAGPVGSYMLDNEKVFFVGNSIRLRVDAGAEDPLTGAFSTGYLGLGADHARYEFSGLDILNETIVGFNVYAFDGYLTSGFTGLTAASPANYVHLLSPTTISFDLDGLLFKDRNIGTYNYAEFRIDLLTRPNGGGGGDLPEPATWALLSVAVLGLWAGRSRRGSRGNR